MYSLVGFPKVPSCTKKEEQKEKFTFLISVQEPLPSFKNPLIKIKNRIQFY